MKKLVLAAAMLISFMSFATAQKVTDSTTAGSAVKKSRHVKSSAKATSTATAATAQTKPVPTGASRPATTSITPLKKDGTPDRRYKNAGAKASGPLKKDSTPDKRFKANKKS